MNRTIAFVCAALVFQFALQGGEYERCLDAIFQLYDFVSWSNRTEKVYPNLVSRDFTFSVTNSPHVFLIRETEDENTDGLVVRESYGCLNLTNEDESVVLIYGIGKTVAQAQLALLNHFSLCSATQPFPAARSVGLDVGDRGYVGWGKCRPPEAVSFVRNNVYVNLVGSDGVCVTNLAVQIDQAILSLSQRENAGAMSRAIHKKEDIGDREWKDIREVRTKLFGDAVFADDLSASRPENLDFGKFKFKNIHLEDSGGCYYEIWPFLQKCG